MQGVLEIVQTTNDPEPLFEVWLRRTKMSPISPGSSSYGLGFDRKKLSTGSVGAPPPSHWPVPADKSATLATALPWYLEEYIQQPTGFAIERQRHVLRALYDWGRDVFAAVFSSDDALRYYSELASTSLSQRNRIEIHSSDIRVLGWPWECLFDSDGVAISYQMAVERRLPTSALPPAPLQKDPALGIDVLLLSARRDAYDVDYRIVGRPLSKWSPHRLRVTMVRPPTLENLKRTMESSARSWDVLHIDCHGVWGAPELGGAPEAHLLLEGQRTESVIVSTQQFVKALGDRCPPHLVLNACRSAKVDERNDTFLSLPALLLDNAAVCDVTAMGHNLHVAAMEAFLAPFYGSLASGEDVSSSAHIARLMMQQNKKRSYAGGITELEDWFIPVVYRRAPADVEEDIVPVTHFGGESADESELFVGRSDVFFLLDRCCDAGFECVLLHGMLGQGKSATMREFVRWRRRTGDPRPVAWIDCEEVASFDDILRAIARALPGQEPEGEEALRAYIAPLLAERPHIVVLDHVYALAPDWRVSSSAPSENRVQTALSEFIAVLARSGSFFLLASRSEESWILGSRRASFPMGGMPEDDRWLLANTILPDDTSDVGQRLDREALRGLVFYAAGHPATTIGACRQAAVEQPDAILKSLQEAAPQHACWLQDSPDADRLLHAFECLEHPDVARVAPLLALHKEMFDEVMLGDMCALLYDNGVDTFASALRVLEREGLAHSKKFLHPGFAGALAAAAQSRMSDDVRRAFVDAIYGAIVSPGSGRSTPPALTFGTMRSAMNCALEAGEFSKASRLGSEMMILALRRRDPVRARAIETDFLYALAGNSDHSDAMHIMLRQADVARVGGNFQVFEVWLNRAHQQSARGDIAASELAFLAYESAKAAEIKGDVTGTREAVKRGLSLVGPSDEDLRQLLIYEAAQLDLRAGGSAAIERLGEEIEGDVDPHMRAAIYRTQAQHAMANAKFDAARSLLQRAVSLDAQAGLDGAKAMNISLLAEVEDKAGDFHAARQHFEEAIRIFEERAELENAAVSYHQLGKAFYQHGLMEEAGDRFVASAALFAQVGHSGNVELIRGNFVNFLSNLDSVSAMGMVMRWRRAGLPDRGMENVITDGLRAMSKGNQTDDK